MFSSLDRVKSEISLFKRVRAELREEEAEGVDRDTVLSPGCIDSECKFNRESTEDGGV